MFIRAHAKSLKKAKQKLKELTSRSQGRNVRVVMYKVKVFIRGWLGYFYIASMRNTMKSWDEWLRRRFRMYIWKQWKLPRTRVKNLMKLGLPEWRACEVAYSRKAYWRSAAHASVQTAISSKRLAQAGYYVRVSALMRLNRRVPNGTHGGVRGRGLFSPSYSIQLYLTGTTVMLF